MKRELKNNSRDTDLRKPTSSIADTSQKGDFVPFAAELTGQVRPRRKLSCWGWSGQVAARPAVKRRAGTRLQLPRLRVPRGSLPDVIGGTGDTRSTRRGLRARFPQQPPQRDRALCEKAELCRGRRVSARSSHFLSIPAPLAVLPGNRGCGQDVPR